MICRRRMRSGTRAGPTDRPARRLAGRQGQLSNRHPRGVTYHAITCSPSKRRKSASLNVTMGHPREQLQRSVHRQRRCLTSQGESRSFARHATQPPSGRTREWRWPGRTEDWTKFEPPCSLSRLATTLLTMHSDESADSKNTRQCDEKRRRQSRNLGRPFDAGARFANHSEENNGLPG